MPQVFSSSAGPRAGNAMDFSVLPPPPVIPTAMPSASRAPGAIPFSVVTSMPPPSVSGPLASPSTSQAAMVAAFVPRPAYR
ncbi:unnamed protein product [Soboliphyme baturini]|uniref:Uncharacterized protein n=1 Tax=Soboliphyme baturini TaxID=241478 RepID=A0A183ILA2_9BILA|nr:unnamed protein product [Soboliphyme baturini]